jgi:hypothetical protein
MTIFSIQLRVVWYKGTKLAEGPAACIFRVKTVPCVGNSEQRRPQPMFRVSAKLWWHSDIFIWDPSFWTLRTSEV